MEYQGKHLDFQKLVDELVKPNPNQNKVRELTGKLGLPYKRDPIAQLDFALKLAPGFLSESSDGRPEKSDLKGPL